METTSLLYSYKETRLDLDPTTSGSTIAVRLPSTGASTYRTQKRTQVTEIPIAEDENAFRQRHLATAASIYYRTYNKIPRSFLWRILEDGKVLSIRAVDVSRAKNEADPNLTLRITFPSVILPGCIAFSDSEGHDKLSVFVVTDQKHLFTLSLHPELFRKPSSSEDVEMWCKSYGTSALSFKSPYRLAALSADQLLISMRDGSLVRFERKSGGDGMFGF